MIILLTHATLSVSISTAESQECQFLLLKVFSGVLRGLVTDPIATAPAIAKPRAADFPRPLAAVMVTVFLNIFSAIASMNFTTAFA